MAKSIHERVRASLEKKAREERQKADRAHDAAERKAERADMDYERGVDAFETLGYLPKGANARMREGFEAASRADLESQFETAHDL